jgi:pimeloyl-ACP methyl ester carboxylesterase
MVDRPRTMRTLIAIALLAVLSACGGVQPADLARTTRYDLARSDGGFVTVDGLRMFAITKGTGRDVVLIHGNPASTYSWRKVIVPLAARYRVHAIDLPGYGFSDKPSDGLYSAEWFDHYVVGYLDAVGAARAVLVGNSMGGHVVTETAMLHPERVSALVLIGAAGLPANNGAYPLALRMAGWPIVGPLLRSLPARGRTRDRLRSAVYDPTQITEADVDAYDAPLRTAGGLTAFVARLHQSVPETRVERVRTIAAPTLVITGDSDRLVPPAVARQYHELIRGSELVVMERTGHLPQEERPEQVVAAISRWIDAHP